MDPIENAMIKRSNHFKLALAVVALVLLLRRVNFCTISERC